MIEAVNSVVSNSQVTRVAAEQQSTVRSYAANPERVQEVPSNPIPTAPYVSPRISIDRGYNRAVLEIRDSDTGDVLRQFPTEGQLRAYKNAQQVLQREQRQEAVGSGEKDVPQVSNVPLPEIAAAPENNIVPVSKEA